MPDLSLILVEMKRRRDGMEKKRSKLYDNECWRATFLPRISTNSAASDCDWPEGVKTGVYVIYRLCAAKEELLLQELTRMITG